MRCCERLQAVRTSDGGCPAALTFDKHMCTTHTRERTFACTPTCFTHVSTRTTQALVHTHHTQPCAHTHNMLHICRNPAHMRVCLHVCVCVSFLRVCTYGHVHTQTPTLLAALGLILCLFSRFLPLSEMMFTPVSPTLPAHSLL